MGWSKPAQPASASPIQRYIVTVGPVTREVTVSAGDPVGTTYWLNVVDTGALQNGTSYSITVSARNDAFGPLTNWNTAETSGTPAGAPLVLGTPSAEQLGNPQSPADGQSVRVDWNGVFASNGRPIDRFYIWHTDGSESPPACQVTGVEEGNPSLSPPPGTTRVAGDVTQHTIPGLAGDRTYRVVVYAHNGQGCTQSPETTARTVAQPGRVTAITTAGGVEVAPGRWETRITGVTTSVPGEPIPFVQYRYVGEGVSTAPSTPAALPLTPQDGVRHYGRELGVDVRVCRDVGALNCGPWSSTFSIPVAVRIDVQPTFVVTDGPAPERRATITWTPIDTANRPAYTSVDYLCRAQPDDEPISFESGSCEIAAPPSSDPRLEVTVSVGGTSYTRIYRP